MGASFDPDRAFLASALAVTEQPKPRPRTAWRPLRVYSPDRDLGTTVSHVYGYRAECSCGWTSRVRPTVAGCRFEIVQHRDEAHDGR